MGHYQRSNICVMGSQQERKEPREGNVRRSIFYCQVMDYHKPNGLKQQHLLSCSLGVRSQAHLAGSSTQGLTWLKSRSHLPRGVSAGVCSQLLEAACVPAPTHLRVSNRGSPLYQSPIMIPVFPGNAQFLFKGFLD